LESNNDIKSERMKVRRVIESQFGVRLNNGWILEPNKRTWLQDGAPVTRISGMWGYRNEYLLRLRKFYEEKLKHSRDKFYTLPTLGMNRGSDLIDPHTGKLFTLEYSWLILVENSRVPLVDAMRILGEVQD